MLTCGAVLKAETETCMRLLGVERVDQLGMQYINTRAVERDIWDGPGLERQVVRAKL
jgi:L-lactate dehydrogenase (cytochrome)